MLQFRTLGSASFMFKDVKKPDIEETFRFAIMAIVAIFVSIVVAIIYSISS